MNVVLDKYDLLNLVKSQSPNLYSEPNRYKAFGDFWGQGPEWKWDDNKLKESSNEELWSLYLELKKDSTNKKNPLSQNTICQEISLPEHPDAFGTRICHECNGIMTPSFRPTIFTCPNQNKEIKISNVHYHQCESCGELIYSSSEAKLIESAILKACKDCIGE